MKSEVRTERWKMKEETKKRGTGVTSLLTNISLFYGHP